MVFFTGNGKGVYWRSQKYKIQYVTNEWYNIDDDVLNCGNGKYYTSEYSFNGIAFGLEMLTENVFITVQFSIL